MELILAPDSRLETKVEKYDVEALHPAPIALNMMEIMEKHNGLGLSANQVGFPFQIFVMRTFLNKEYGDPTVVINPIIKGLSEEIEGSKEGCLSHPGLNLTIRRPISCMVQFQTLTSDLKNVILVETKFDELDARIFLHEYDHMYGVQFIDRVSKLKLEMAEKKRLKKEKRKAYG